MFALDGRAGVVHEDAAVAVAVGTHAEVGLVLDNGGLEPGEVGLDDRVWRMDEALADSKFIGIIPDIGAAKDGGEHLSAHVHWGASTTTLSRRGVRRNFSTCLRYSGQRSICCAASGVRPNPYSDYELTAIAANCSQKGDAARKVEREMSKRLAAVAMCHRVGETFDAIVTGVTPKGTFVRVLQPHIEGLLAQGAQGLHVGDKIRAKLTRTDVQRGFIDFARTLAIHAQMNAGLKFFAFSTTRLSRK